MASGIKYNSNGHISATFAGATTSAAFAASTPNAADTASQAVLQTQLAAAGLPVATQVFSSAADALSSAGLSAQPSASSVFDDDDDESDDESETVVAKKIVSRSADTSLSKRSPMSKFRLDKRHYSFGDFLDDVDTYACNDFVTGLCEYVEDACDIKDGVEAIYCLATQCYQSTTTTTLTEYPIDQKSSFTMPGFVGGIVHQGAKSSLSCISCGMTISNLEVSGSLIVNLQDMTVTGMTLVLEQDSVAKFDMSLDSGGADTGSWSYVMSTYNIETITSANVFSIS